MKRLTLLTLLVVALFGCSSQDSNPVQGDCDFVGPLEQSIEKPNDC